MNDEFLERYADVVWQYDASGGGPAARIQSLQQWPDEGSRGELHLALLAVELEKTTPPQKAIELLPHFAEELGSEHLVIGMCRDFYDIAINTGLDIEWRHFEGLGIPADRLLLKSALDPYHLGATVGNRYVIRARLGVGAFGVVYRAHCLQTNKIVAIKCSYGTTPAKLEESSRLLKREAHCLERLSGRGFPQFLGTVEIANDRVALVMEFIEGITLEAKLAAGCLNMEDSADICAQLAEAVDHMHCEGWVHRDLKPENVVVRDDGQVFLLDLGLTLTDSDRFSSNARRAGTINYMSPESISGSAQEVDERSDLWSIGALLYELLTGERFQAEADARNSLRKALSINPSVRLIPAGQEMLLEEVLHRCMAVDRLQRYSRGRELAEDLRFLARAVSRLPCPRNAHAIHGWRLGVAIGKCFHVLGSMHRFVSPLVPRYIDDPILGSESQLLTQVLEYARTLLFLTDELLDYLSSLAIMRCDVGRIPGEERLANIVHQAPRTSQTLNRLALHEMSIRNYLDVLETAIHERLHDYGANAAACFELGSASLLDSIHVPDCTFDWREACQRGGIDEQLWSEFLSLSKLNRNKAWMKLNRAVECHFIFSDADRTTRRKPN